MNQIMRSNYRRIFKVSWNIDNPNHPSNMGAQSGARWDAVSGHFPYGLHRAFGEGDDARYVTLLRDPVARTISAFNYLRNDSKYVNSHPDLKAHLGSMSIIDFCREFHDRIPGHVYTDNGQVRYLSGVGESKEFGGLSRADLDAAKRNLESMEFGLAEDFNLSMLYLQRRMAWKSILYSRARVGSARKLPLSDKELSAVMERNAYDIELYKFGKELFDKRTAEISHLELDVYSRQLGRHEHVTRMMRAPRAIIHRLLGLRNR